MKEHYLPSGIWTHPESIDYSETQKLTLYITYYLTPPLSLLGSLCFVYAVWKGKLLSGRCMTRYHRMPRPTCVRLLLGFSIMDSIKSFGGLMFGPWSVPLGTPFVYRPAGTIQTCAASGFFFNLYAGLWIYSGCLAIYHALIIRLEWKEEYLAKRLEPFFHLFAWIYPLVVSILSLRLRCFNPVGGLPGFCWISSVPTACTRLGLNCYRGEKYLIFSLLVASGSIVLSFLVISISFFFVYRKVRMTEKKMAE